MTLEWTDKDAKAVDTARILAADAVEKVGNGHPGTPVSLAPVAYLLYQKVMNTDPSDDLWIGRDRFVLSAGHASLTQYTQLYLAGLDMELDDIKALRTWGSKTPGHPEYGHTKFVECTTGPLGAGVSNAVGMAMAARRERGIYEPEAAAGESLFDRMIYCIAGDGCLQEGISSEASSLAATQNLGNLVLIYDDNRITIEGKTKIAFSEDVSARYEAYGWHVQHVDWTNGGTEYVEDVEALHAAIEEAKKVTDKPSFIKLTTIIGWPLPNKQGHHSVHGSKIGGDEIAALKEALGFEPEPFAIDESVVEYTRANAAERGRAAREAWDAKFKEWEQANPERAELLKRARARKLPQDLSLPVFEEGKKATRAASGEVLTALASQLPELWGGSADLAGSNNTTMKGEPSFLPDERATDEWPGNQYGRTLHFGIREHAMGGILNGINMSALTRAYGGTFLVFSDYMRPAVRLAAITRVPSIFVWTHDSVGVGEDGPTHQPVEHLAALRAIPGLDVVRPSDANETSVAWGEILRRADRPAGLILSRQDLRTIARGEKYASAEGVANGAYVVSEASSEPTLILIASGSEVEVALDAQEKLEADGVSTRVVSMPCQEWFDEQPAEYRESVLPAAVTARVSIEAGIAMGWSKYVGEKGTSVSLEHYGASASGAKCFEEFGFTVDNLVSTAKALLG
ncbi:transketolase [Tessaracoccus flavus]|uniref:Transketolase n=1 Tax=Tessaracoccus flavus TaxID=1610493 RepID=A0A1Q2CGE3_9ACTN|nr:transketolase [Tessaracoccus flavus]AQP45130.1 transketolase [Tessaracoccus flavus]SDY55579.1 transketolase [Tessaracoccus flavus]